MSSLRMITKFATPLTIYRRKAEIMEFTWKQLGFKLIDDILYLVRFGSIALAAMRFADKVADMPAARAQRIAQMMPHTKLRTVLCRLR